ncbi:hypothetical protein FJZ31_30665 [Candidatus Poribacteria bacterium]|nr:hypothetical protein [Candidatus Poribacteria bacterium]
MSTSKRQELTLEMRHLTNQMVKEIGTGGPVRRALRWIRQLFFLGPRAEICHDWLIVRSFAERVFECIISSMRPVDDKKKRTLATVQAYLLLAKKERDFAQAWTYINSADALLPLVVNDDECDACCARLRTFDRYLPDSSKDYLVKFLLDNLDERNKAAVLTDKQQYRNILYDEQITRAQLWNSQNRKVS